MEEDYPTLWQGRNEEGKVEGIEDERGGGRKIKRLEAT